MRYPPTTISLIIRSEERERAGGKRGRHIWVTRHGLVVVAIREERGQGEGYLGRSMAKGYLLQVHVHKGPAQFTAFHMLCIALYWLITGVARWSCQLKLRYRNPSIKSSAEGLA
ncbi:hypothetical protein WG66_016036 [Moniliophthora roreri]|nr:hypothetical protein WG66_016036 [Moniliophthora roreri]